MCLSTGSIKLDSFVIRSMRNASGKVKMWQTLSNARHIIEKMSVKGVNGITLEWR